MTLASHVPHALHLHMQDRGQTTQERGASETNSLLLTRGITLNYVLSFRSIYTHSERLMNSLHTL